MINVKFRIKLYFIIVVLLFFGNFYFRPIKGNKLVTSSYRDSSAFINELYMSDEYFKKKILKKELYSSYRKVIDSSLNNESKVTIDCGDNCSRFSNVYYAIYLDHPELISFAGISGYFDNGQSVSYSNYQNLGKIKTYFGTKRIAREMENIRRDTKNMSDKEKIIYVYDYVASHNYDRLFTYLDVNQSAYSFFSKKSSVCAGFAKASQIIFQNIGIESYLVLSSDHMWNYVKYKGKYYIFDATMGASLYDKSNPHFYDGLGETTTGEKNGMFEEYYPKIEDVALKKVFKL